MPLPKFMHAASAVAAFAAGAVALAQPSQAAPEEPNSMVTWRMIMRLGDRVGILIDEPVRPRMGDIVELRMMYVYSPEVTWEEKPVGWQEYSRVQINCATWEVKLGPLSRHGPNGEVLFSSSEEEFVYIQPETSSAEAAELRCLKDDVESVLRFEEAPGWMDAVRGHIAKPEEEVEAESSDI